MLVVTLLILTMLTVGFVFQTSRSLENVVLRNVTNIVVSQEELVMDVLVSAGNPNILPVVMGETISIDVFARSDQIKDKGESVLFHIASTDPEEDGDVEGEKALGRRWPPWHKDPPDEDPKPPKNITEGTSLLLGTIHTLETPLQFPPTTFRRSPDSLQKTQMKLVGPAVNSTDGDKKWRKVIQTEFELIVRGTMKYRAPIGGRERVVGVEWRGNVDPKGNRVWNGDEWEDGYRP